MFRWVSRRDGAIQNPELNGRAEYRFVETRRHGPENEGEFVAYGNEERHAAHREIHTANDVLNRSFRITPGTPGVFERICDILPETHPALTADGKLAPFWSFSFRIPKQASGFQRYSDCDHPVGCVSSYRTSNPERGEGYDTRFRTWYCGGTQSV